MNYSRLKKLVRKNKKGSVVDTIFIILVAVVFSCALLIGLAFYTGFDDEIQDSNVITQDAKDASTAIKAVYTGPLKWGYVFLIIGLSILSIGLAAMVRVHSVFIVFFWIAWAIGLLISGIASNIFDEMASNPALSTAASELGIVSIMARSLPWVIAVVGTLVMIVMYKSRGDPYQ